MGSVMTSGQMLADTITVVTLIVIAATSIAGYFLQRRIKELNVSLDALRESVEASKAKRRLTTLEEGKVKKGGVNQRPTTPRPPPPKPQRHSPYPRRFYTEAEWAEKRKRYAADKLP